MKSWVKKLIFSMVLSVIIWSLLVSWKFGLIIVAAIFIHEYGHFYWMGREGLKNRDMIFLPPFGALARAIDMWPSRGAEARIALAGPAFGFISVLLFIFLWFASGLILFGAAALLACLINLFNLLAPVSILDGGRVIKSIGTSIYRKFEFYFYLTSLALPMVFSVLGYLSPIFALVLMFLTWLEFRNLSFAERELHSLEKLIPDLEKVAKYIEEKEADGALGKELKQSLFYAIGGNKIENLKRKEKELRSFVELPSMTSKEIFQSTGCFLLIVGLYIITISLIGNYTDIARINIHKYF